MPKLSLDRILQSQGIGSRAECRALISRGAVAVGDKTEKDYRVIFDTTGLAFSIEGKSWDYREKVYIALNKPAGFECSRGATSHPSVLSLLPPHFDARGVQPVGRLDQDTTGLLLLSDDGAFIHAQASPKRHVPKTYVAETADPVTDSQLEALRRGVRLKDEDGTTAALSCRALGDRELEIVIDQGKYHQVKRMIAAAGNRCAALRRTAVGALELEALGIEEGEWRLLADEELEALRRN